MDRPLAWVWFVLFALLCLPGVARAQQYGEIRGLVVDTEEIAVPNVLITVRSPQLMGERQTTTDAEGRFLLTGLPPGTYEVEAQVPRFARLLATDVLVLIGKTAAVSLTLTPNVDGTIVVRGDRALIDLDDPNRGLTMSKALLQNIPGGRTYQGRVGLTPGATGGANASLGGSASNENTIRLDGIDITDPVTGTFTANFNFDAIEQLQVLTSAFDPEYSNLGGTINIVTETGSNTLRFKTGLYVLNGEWSPRQESRWAADGTFLAPTDFESAFQTYQLGVKVSGPIVRDKAWFVASYQTERSLISTAGVATPRDFEGHYVLTKLTVQPNPQHRLTAFLQTDPTTIDNLAANDRFVLPEAQPRQTQGGFVSSLQWDWFMGESASLETKASVQRSSIQVHGVPCTHDLTSGNNPCGPSELANTVDYETPGRIGINNAYNSGSYGAYTFDNRWRNGVQARLRLFGLEAAGSHDVTVGGDADMMSWDQLQGYSGNLQYVDWNLQAFNPDTFSNYYWLEQSNPVAFRATSEVYSAFVQDAWRPINNVSLRAGVRFDRQLFRADTGQPVLDTALWGPRASANWDPWDNAKTKLSASVGRFNESGRLGVASFLGNANFGTKLYLGEVFGGFTNGADNNFSYAPLANTNTVADRLTQPHADVFSVGVERELATDLSGLFYLTGKYTRDLYAVDETNFIWDQDGYNVLGSADGTLVGRNRLRTPAVARRDYYRFDATLRKIESQRWQGEGTYSTTVSRGFTQVGPTGRLAVGPQVPYYTNGRLPTDIRHSVKLAAVWDVPTDPWTTQLGAVVLYESGSPLTRAYDGGFNNTLLYSTLGTYARTEPWLDVSLRVEQQIPVRRGAVSGVVELQNAFNLRQGQVAGIGFDNRTVIAARNNPTRLQLGAEVEF